MYTKELYDTIDTIYVSNFMENARLPDFQIKDF